MAGHARNAIFWTTRAIAAAAVALTLTACSGDLTPSLNLRLVDPDRNMFTKTGEATGRAITVNDLIGANGRCPGEPEPGLPSEGAPQALNFTAGPQAGQPLAQPPAPAAPSTGPVRRGVALGMTECDVVRTLGHTDRIEMATDDRGQRRVSLTYPGGERPGIYRFAGGQLVSVERTNEPPPAAPKAKKAKKT